MVGNVVAACVMCGLICIGYSALGLYGAARRKIPLLRVHGLFSVVLILLSLVGVIMGVVGTNDAPAMVSRLADTSKPKKDILRDLRTFYLGYAAAPSPRPLSPSSCLAHARQLAMCGALDCSLLCVSCLVSGLRARVCGSASVHVVLCGGAGFPYVITLCGFCVQCDRDIMPGWLHVHRQLGFHDQLRVFPEGNQAQPYSTHRHCVGFAQSWCVSRECMKAQGKLRHSVCLGPKNVACACPRPWCFCPW
jgi:hypothetical protein